MSGGGTKLIFQIIVSWRSGVIIQGEGPSIAPSLKAQITRILSWIWPPLCQSQNKIQFLKLAYSYFSVVVVYVALMVWLDSSSAGHKLKLLLWCRYPCFTAADRVGVSSSPNCKYLTGSISVTCYTSLKMPQRIFLNSFYKLLLYNEIFLAWLAVCLIAARPALMICGQLWQPAE